MNDWFARPVLHVKSVGETVRFFERIGFAKAWAFEDEVAQVERQGCAIILSNQWQEKVGMGLVFVSMNIEPHAAHVAALDAWKAEVERSGVGVKEGSWGYRILIIEDPDGNQIYFNYPNES